MGEPNASSRRAARIPTGSSPHRFDERWLRLGRVADRDQDIAQKAVAAGPLDRGASKQGAETAIVKRSKLGQARRGQRLARQERGLMPSLREFVPRADREA